MKTKKWITQTAIVCTLLIMTNTYVWSQYVSPGALVDANSQASYNAIRTSNSNMTGKAVRNATIFVPAIAKTITTEYLDLTTAMVIMHRKKVKDYIKKNSFDFIKEKYPKLQAPPNTQEVFKNTLIRTRFALKLKREAKKTENYFRLDNPISEGQRLLLALSSIEKVLKICLENETYY